MLAAFAEYWKWMIERNLCEFIWTLDPVLYRLCKNYRDAIRMSDLGSNLLTRYGIWAVVAAVILAVAVWTLAHFASAPGAPVKILWGLVEYTKPPSRQERTPLEPPTTPVAPMAEAPALASADPEPTSQPSPGLPTLEVSHGLTSDGYMEVITALRSRHALRELGPLETDRPIKASPPGTFFFVPAASLEKRSNSSGPTDLVHSRVFRLQSSSWRRFEIHHRIKGQFLLLVYAPEPDADRIRMLTGDRELQLTTAPRPWGAFSSLVELPIERIISSKRRRLQTEENRDLDVLELAVAGFTDQVQHLS